MISAISNQVFTLAGCVYVDDCDLLHAVENPFAVMTPVQTLSNSWGTFIEVTGGAILTDKSC